MRTTEREGGRLLGNEHVKIFSRRQREEIKTYRQGMKEIFKTICRKMAVYFVKHL